MIYHETQSDNLIETYLNLEELVCLSKMTNTLCKLKTSDRVKNVFELSEFDVVDEILDPVIHYDLSDYVCVFKNDPDMYQEEFISHLYLNDRVVLGKYHQRQLIPCCELEVFNYQNLNVIFSYPNFYESKYYASDSNVHSTAIRSASNFHLNTDFVKKYESFGSTFRSKPLLCLSKDSIENLTEIIKFPFTDCFYAFDDEDTSLVQKFLLKNSLIGYDIKSMISGFNKNILKHEIDMVLLSAVNNFSDLYGCAGDMLFGVLSKQFFKNSRRPKIIGELFADYEHYKSTTKIENFEIAVVNTKANFDFSKYDLKVHRIDLMRMLRFSDCVNNFIQSTDDVR